VEFLFFSAKIEQQRLDEMEREMNVADATGQSRLEAAIAAGGGGVQARVPRRLRDAEDAIREDDGSSDGSAELAGESEGDEAEDGDDVSVGSGAVEVTSDAESGGDGDAADRARGGKAVPASATSAAARADMTSPELQAKYSVELRHRCRVVGREEFIDWLSEQHARLRGDAVDGADAESGDGAGAGAGAGSADDVEDVSDGESDSKASQPLVIGLVGYPNVGKSSTINALMGASSSAHGVKRVSVGATPGKTKHFQVCGVLRLVSRPIRRLLCPCSVSPALNGRCVLRRRRL
jgi:hypothetical protein